MFIICLNEFLHYLDESERGEKVSRGYDDVVETLLSAKTG